MNSDREDTPMVVIYNVNMVGLYGVGKTSIINKLKKNVFGKSYKPTEDKKTLKHTLTETIKELEDKTVKISFRDSAGLTNTNTQNLSFLNRKAHILCFVYDYDNIDSFNCIKSILETNDFLFSSNRIIMVIRNKIDNKTIITDTEDEINEQFKEITSINEEIIFIKNFSAKNKSSDKIEKIFIKAIELYRDYYGEQPAPGPPNKKKKENSKADTYNTTESNSQLKKNKNKNKSKKKQQSNDGDKNGKNNNNRNNNNENGCSCIIL